jgi:glycosyltransferase involved in cell wall biosynthesis
MKISVISPCFNAAKTLPQMLDSFCAQDHADKELLVMDGASSDDTLKIIESYNSENVTVHSQIDSGMYDALNRGLSLYTGDAIGVLNADDTYHDAQVLSRVAAALAHAPMAQGHLNFVTDHTSKSVTRRWHASPRPLGGFKTGWMPAHPTFYVRREVADKVGAFDLTLRTASDYDWMLRACDIYKFDLALIDAVMIDMQVGGRSTKGLISSVQHNFEALSARRQWLGVGAVDYALIAKPLRKLNQFFSKPN